ncbi:MAG: glycosyltransferase [Desulfobacterales bacterium]|nr:glycosyltransferase [Desulfobacterales bacterium]
MKTSPPLISIITVVLNGAETLEKAIMSVLDQRFVDFEYIIIDGGSVDGSVEIIKKYESRLSRWVSECDSGVYDAMNKAIALTNGQWVYFLGADDQLLDGFKKASKYLKDETTLYYGNVYRPVANRDYDGEFTAYKLACRNICHQSIFYPRRVYDKYRYNLKYSGFADYELNMRCFFDPGINFQYIPVSVAIFSDAGGLSQAKSDIDFEKDKLFLIKEMFPFWIYVLIFVRSMLLKIIVQLKFQRIFLKMYHSWLRSRSPVPIDESVDDKRNFHKK